MNNENKRLADYEILRNWINTIPLGEYEKVFARLLEVCLVSKYTFANWRYGRCRIPESGKRDINEVTKEISGIEIFTIALPGTKAEA